ncbi:hypothetical protein L208DRAFT_1405131 [Tricholoma matsutake]|nr:hypothetical protein L208DRAFT_1405131 [Tricholoma matsutake 945]
MSRLRAHTFRDSEAVIADSFSIAENALASSTGWQGRAPPKKTQSELKALHRSGRIVELLKVFYPVPYPMPPSSQRERGAAFIDRDGRTFIYRSFRAPWLPALAGDLSDTIQALLQDTLRSKAIEKQQLDAPRGPHYPCIIGHCRQYQKHPHLTAFHKLNSSKVDRFISSPVVFRIRWVKLELLPAASSDAFAADGLSL